MPGTDWLVLAHETTAIQILVDRGYDWLCTVVLTVVHHFFVMNFSNRIYEPVYLEKNDALMLLYMWLLISLSLVWAIKTQYYRDFHR